jgi:hypothetical protein
MHDSQNQNNVKKSIKKLYATQTPCGAMEDELGFEGVEMVTCQYSRCHTGKKTCFKIFLIV